jgi:hypothetical protein
MKAGIFGVVATAAIVLAAGVRPAAGQAWVLPDHTGSITFVVQEIDHVGRMTNDGTRLAVGKAINLGIDLEADYAFTNRFSISTTMPYVISKYTDPNPPPFDWMPFPTADKCRCWQTAFADFGFTSRYNVVNVDRAFMLTPFVAVGVPSHGYDYVGEAVVGRRLKELRFGADAGQRLDAVLPGLSVQAGYRYTIVGRVLDVPNNRSNGSVEASYALPRGLSTDAIFSWQRTHGGLRFPDEVNVPEIPARLTEFHRMLRDNYLHVGAGLSYSRGAWDVSGSFLVTARGSNSHDIHVFTVTVGRLFEIHGRKSS